jgi:hypothetical protein
MIVQTYDKPRFGCIANSDTGIAVAVFEIVLAQGQNRLMLVRTL